MTNHSSIANSLSINIEIGKHDSLWCASGTTRIHYDGKVSATTLFVIITLVEIRIGDKIFPKHYATIVRRESDFFDVKCSVEFFLEKAKAIRWTNYNNAFELCSIT